MKKILLLILASILFTACSSPNYSSDHYSLNYPESYSLQESTEDFQVLTLLGEKGRIEVFKTSDFGLERIHGFSSSGIEEFEAELVPKEQIRQGDYEIWLFYTEGDEAAQQELQKIANSLEIK